VDYQQTLDYIYGFVNFETLPVARTAEHFDLRRMYELMGQLGNPQEAARSIHITGTKGKGSTAAMIASVLTASGYTTGLYTSPHLLDMRERIQINGEPIPVADLISLVERLRPDFEAVHEKATYGKLTTFEILTALGFAYFQQRGVDVQVLEVGLGGRLDATNVISSPEVCIITSISYDHTDVLGDTLAKIATEKSGIIKPGCVVVSSLQSDEAREVIEKKCLECGVSLIQVGSDVTWRGTSSSLEGQILEVAGRMDRYKVNIPLLGDHQMENAAVAVAALEVMQERGFHLTEDNIINGLGRVKWPGRFQILRRRPMVILDGAHNHDSARKLRLTLEQYCGLSAGKTVSGTPAKPAILIFGASLDKNIHTVVSEIVPIFDRVIVTTSHNPRAMAPSRIIEEYQRYGVKTEVTPDVKTALNQALSLAGESGLICITGSLFVVAEALEHLGTPATH
jgi:dihydrofolate synthase/folylpolyglutamate synthase